MKIGVDASAMMGDRGGVGWHTYYLLRAMMQQRGTIEILAYVNPGTLNRACMEPWMRSPGLTWIESGRWGRRWRGWIDRLDLYHGPNFKMHTSGRRGGVVTIHDLWLDRHPEYSTKFLGQSGASRRATRMARRARAVITVSNFSAGEITALYGVPADRIQVIPNGVSEEFVPLCDEAAMSAFRRRVGLGPGPYILFVGGADPRKNHRLLFEAVAGRRKELGRLPLVLAGSATHRYGSYMETARRFGLEEQVICTGRLPIQEIRLLYSHAQVLVYPSLYEGFGMPVLEGMACGVPVVTSKTSALGEVAGDAAACIDPEDPAALAEAIIRIGEDEPRRAEMRARGFDRARQFTWRRAADLTLSLYRRLCG